MVDRLARAARSAADRQRLALAVRDSAPGTQEPDWLEWKRTLDLSRPDDRFEMARFILGAANRDPDRAASDAEGTAYLVAGVEPGLIHGVKRLDVSAIEDAVSPFVGTDDESPAWAVQYTSLDGRDILVVTVEAPRPGDPARTLRRDHKSFQAGYVFIRRPGQTRQANPSEVRMLGQRLLARNEPVNRLDVNVDWRARPNQLQVVDLSNAAVARWVRRERDDALGRGSITEAEAAELLNRRPQAADYLRDAGNALPLMACTRVLDGAWPTLSPVVSNPTDRYLESARLEITIGVPGAFAFTYNDEPADRAGEWPQRPARSTLDAISLLTARPHLPVVPVAGDPEVTRGLYGSTVVWPSIDVHAHTSEGIGDLYIVLPHPRYVGLELTFPWRITARSTVGELSGAIRVTAPTQPRDLLQLVPVGGLAGERR